MKVIATWESDNSERIRIRVRDHEGALTGTLYLNEDGVSWYQYMAHSPIFEANWSDFIQWMESHEGPEAEGRIRALVEAALAKLSEPYTEDVTDEVLGIIENTPARLAEYYEISEGLTAGTDQLNQDIGRSVKEITDREVLSEGNTCQRNNLAKTYSKLIVRTE